MPLGNREGGRARKRSQDISSDGYRFPADSCLERYVSDENAIILKIPSEQPMGCSDFVFPGEASEFL